MTELFGLETSGLREASCGAAQRGMSGRLCRCRPPLLVRRHFEFEFEFEFDFGRFSGL